MSLAHRLGLAILADIGGRVSSRQRVGFMSSTGNFVVPRTPGKQYGPKGKKGSRKNRKKK